MPLTIEQQKAFAFGPKVAGPFSMFGSACIIKAVVTDKEKLACTYHRILLTMSSVDFMVSFWFFMSTWPIPKGTADVWQPVGNQMSCNVQGFFLQLNAAVPLLNGSLAIYYLLFCTYQWSVERIRKVEPLLIGVPLIVGTSTAIAGLPLKLYNNALLWCWIAPFPLDCKDSVTYGDEGNCIRGDNSWLYRVAFKFGGTWLSIIVATVCMLLVYLAVLRQEKAVDSFQQNGESIRRQSTRVAWQSFWYLMVFYITWTPTTIWRFLDRIPATRGQFFYPLVVIIGVVLPLQGFLNFLVYSRSRYYKYVRENPRASLFDAVAVAAFSWGGKDTDDESYQSSKLELNDTSMSMFSVLTEAILKSEVFSMVRNTHGNTEPLSDTPSDLPSTVAVEDSQNRRNSDK